MKFHIKIDEKIKNNLKNYFNIEINDNYIKLNETILLMQLITGIDKTIFEEIVESINNKLKKRTNRPNKVSQIIFDILEKESRIQNKEVYKIFVETNFIGLDISNKLIYIMFS